MSIILHYLLDTRAMQSREMFSPFAIFSKKLYFLPLDYSYSKQPFDRLGKSPLIFHDLVNVLVSKAGFLRNVRFFVLARYNALLL